MVSGFINHFKENFDGIAYTQISENFQWCHIHKFRKRGNFAHRDKQLDLNVFNVREQPYNQCNSSFRN